MEWNTASLKLNKAIIAFNAMNTGGISLGVFDIVSARYSALQEGRLADKILQDKEKVTAEINNEFTRRLINDKFIEDKKNGITKYFTDMYLNMLSIFIKESENEKPGNEVNLDWIRQKLLLKITGKKIQEHSLKALESLILAFQFLIEKCGVSAIQNIKYKLITVPIAYILYKNKDKSLKEKKIIENKIEYSYWVKLFAGKYETGQNISSIDHLNHLIKFVSGSKNEFEKYEKDLCDKKGYSDWEGFSSFYEENTGYSYSTNIGECFLQFILALSVSNKTNIFKNTSDKTIKIDHFENLHKDHIIPSSWIKTQDTKTAFC